MRKTIIVIITCVCIAASANTQQGSGCLSLGTGLLYKDDVDITFAYEYEVNYRHMWEFFVNGYLRWAECVSCGHICLESFWRNYRNYGFSVAYKPCMTRGHNRYGSLRIGTSARSDTNKFLGGLYFGYEHNYVLRAGWTLYWQVKSDVMTKGTNVLRAGVMLGVKLPIKQGDKKESSMTWKIHLVAAATAAVLRAACDTHIDVPDTAVRPGHILYKDGIALPYAQYEQSEEKAVAVVFDTEKHGDTEGDGYAVYLWDIAPQVFADSLGIAQGTSVDIMAYDGNENTFALYDIQGTASPMTEAVFDLWRYGQSAYVSPVTEIRLFYTIRKITNPVIEQCGGEPLPLDENSCWYWTSAEVEKQQTAKAWLYSMGGGATQETSEVQAHKVRPIITINE